jgi:hypothetical protein
MASQHSPAAHRRLSARGRAIVFFAFAFAVMADPVSSVAYAIEAALRALGGHLELLVPTMGLVIGIIALVTLNYWQLVGRFPQGGGSPEAAGRAFGEAWSFLPIGALVVDFALTIAISIAAAGSALIAYFPALAGLRIPLALAMVLAVAALTWFGHGGRLIFAVMTCLFIVASVATLVLGFSAPHSGYGQAPLTHAASPALVAVILAFPVAMALATGTEAPATAIAQLGQLRDAGRRWFGRGTLLVTILIVGALTMGLTVLAVRLHVGIPQADETQIANLARAAAGSGGGLFAVFQLSSGLLLLAAASSSFQAGPGLLKALARVRWDGAGGLLPAPLGRTNRHHTPVWSVVLYAVISAAIIVAARGLEQELVLVYAVAVFVSFLAGLLAMARFSHRRGARLLTATNLLGALAVAFTLIVNLARGYPLLAMAGTALVAGLLYVRWVGAGRPAGLEAIERDAEREPVVGDAAPAVRHVRLGCFGLDQALARGDDPSTSRRLSRRAHDLCDPAMRRKTAADVERVVQAAEEPPPSLTAAVPLNRRAIGELRPLLLTLAEDLRTDDAVNPGGVAIVRLLLRDGSSPLYGSPPVEELEDELCRARAALRSVRR